MSLPNQSRMAKYSFWIFLCILLTGAILRIYGLGAEDLWLDEAISVDYHAGGTLQEMIPSLEKFDCNPPLYFVLLHYWIWLGKDAFTLRLLSALFGIISLLIFYSLAKEIFSKSTALLGTLLLALSPYHLWYSQEARMYSLQVLLILSSFYYFVVILRSKIPKRVDWFYYIFFTTAGLYTHYFTLLIIPVHGIILGTLWKKGEDNILGKCKIWVLAQLVIGLLCIPLLYLIQKQHFLGNTSWIPPLKIQDVLITPLRLLLGAYIVLNKVAIVCGLIIIITVIVLIVLETKKGKPLYKDYFPGIHLCLWWLLLPAIILILISFKKPIYLASRYLVISLPAFFLLLGFIIDNLATTKKNILVGGLIITLSISLGSYYTQQKKIPFHIPVMILQEEKQDTDALVFLPAWEYPGFQYYYRGVAPGYPRTNMPSYFYPEQVIQVWKNSKEHPDRVWYMTVGNDNPETAHFLDAHYTSKDIRWQIRSPIFEKVDLILYHGLVATP